MQKVPHEMSDRLITMLDEYEFTEQGKRTRQGLCWYTQFLDFPVIVGVNYTDLGCLLFHTLLPKEFYWNREGSPLNRQGKTQARILLSKLTSYFLKECSPELTCDCRGVRIGAFLENSHSEALAKFLQESPEDFKQRITRK